MGKGIAVLASTVIDGKPGLHVTSLDAAGGVRWAHALGGFDHVIGFGAAADRVAICTEMGTAESHVLEFDRDGDPTSRDFAFRWRAGHGCAYDEQGALWSVVDWPAGRAIRLGDHERTLMAGGAWAVRLTGAPRFVSLAPHSSDHVAIARSGFVVTG